MNYRPVLNGEHYLTGEEVCERLCISKRTLQDYRDTGLLGYVQLPGKIIYRESDIMDLLERFYQKWNLENMESCFIDVLLSWNIEVLKYSCLVFYIVWLKASNHSFQETVIAGSFDFYLIDFSVLYVKYRRTISLYYIFKSDFIVIISSLVVF